jgi:hypothetical protein
MGYRIYTIIWISVKHCILQVIFAQWLYVSTNVLKMLKKQNRRELIRHNICHANDDIWLISFKRDLPD